MPRVRSKVERQPDGSMRKFPVSKEEADATSHVYPNNNSLLVRRPVKRADGNYDLYMKNLTPFKNLSPSRLKQLKFSGRALNMFENQLTRLHNMGRTHSDLKAKNRHPDLRKRVNGVIRQVLVDIENNTVKRMYLSDFDNRKTSDTKNNEVRIKNDFIRYISQAAKEAYPTPRKPLKRGRNNNNNYGTPKTTPSKRMNSGNFRTPPGSGKKLAF